MPAKKLSRTKLELFLDCPRCFWLEVVRGVKRPSGPPFTINNAVDYLLKQEFDFYREKKKRHPVMEQYEVEALPFEHPDLEKWRHNFTGVQYVHPEHGTVLFGAVDDLWVDPKGRLIVVDYKATGSAQHHIYDSYRRQMEIYQWLLQKNGFEVSPRGYFVFARVSKENGFGHGKAVLPFDLFVEPLDGESGWVDAIVEKAIALSDAEFAPRASDTCEFCTYRSAAGENLDI